MTDEDALALADRLCTAIERGDLDAVSDCYTDDFVSWANSDDRGSDKARSLRVLGWLCARLTDRRYEVRRRQPLPDGYLQEHVLHGTAPDGSTVAMPACLVVTVTGDRIEVLVDAADPVGVAALSR